MVVNVLMPTTKKGIERGLQGFPPVRIDEGMLFPSERFPHVGPIAMWIATVPTPLSMTWLTEGRGYFWPSYIQHNVQPGDPRTFEHYGSVVLESHPALIEKLNFPYREPVAIELD